LIAVIMMNVVGFLFLFLVMMSGLTSHDRNPDVGSGVGGPERITADFLPHKVGARATYAIEMPGVGTAKHLHIYEAGGVIDRTVESIAGRFINQPSNNHRRRESGGFVEVIDVKDTSGIVQHCLKLNATVGDNWTRGVQAFTVESFSTYTIQYDHKPRQCVVIREDNPVATLYDTFVMGIGLVKREGHVNDANGNPISVSWQLDEENYRNMTRSERAFFE
jgi:hypothetical protein